MFERRVIWRKLLAKVSIIKNVTTFFLYYDMHRISKFDKAVLVTPYILPNYDTHIGSFCKFDSVGLFC